MVNYFAAFGGAQRGPFTKEQLLGIGLTPQTLIWRDGMVEWTPAGLLPELVDLFASGVPGASAPYQYVSTGFPDPYGAHSTKMAAGLCGIFFGAFGIHKFVYGANGAGIAMLLITFLTRGFGAFVMHIFGIIEGIIYLTRGDEEFYRVYVLGKKAWF